MACPAIARASRARASRIQVRKAELVGRDLRVAESSRDGDRDEEDRAQRDGADEQRRPAGARHAGPLQPRAAGAALSTRGASPACTSSDVDEGGSQSGRSPSPRPSRPPRSPAPSTSTIASAEVDHGGDDRDHQRGAGVLEPAPHAGPGQHEEHRRQAEGGDPQVGRRVVGGLLDAPSALDRGRAVAASTTSSTVPTARREPQASDPVADRPDVGPPRRPAGRRPRSCRRPGRRTGRRRCPRRSLRPPRRPAARCRAGRRPPRRRAGRAVRRPGPRTAGTASRRISWSRACRRRSPERCPHPLSTGSDGSLPSGRASRDRLGRGHARDKFSSTGLGTDIAQVRGRMTG